MLGQNKPKTAEEKRWQAESDARTLAESDVIRKDNKRSAAAKIMAKEMAERQKQEAEAMDKVAKGQLSYSHSDMKKK